MSSVRPQRFVQPEWALSAEPDAMAEPAGCRYPRRRSPVFHPMATLPRCCFAATNRPTPT